ncbi:RagB/SusD family nutrient uptake outer membrane protein [Butyricimonas synergistica]|uniref:RagB/SusD family nutrient uptake outer membrane protein n=1 Tax=Butyricimonas synergistica TaxID=544644 RepID=UPI00037390FA|nr:RagB/SusD family nutrient uptake outer membrane protein [Butyricimonas synergistica]
MKIRKYLFLSLIVFMSSCSDWLDVSPKDIVDEDDLFTSYLGYRNALNGVYKQMGSTGMYGKELSWGFIDVLAQSYYSGRGYIGQNNDYNDVMELKYTGDKVKAYIETIWTETYNAIANCNNIIARIQMEDSTMFPLGKYEKNLILGEAIGLRAFLHFDMLRLFAPAPIVDDHKLYIPYFDKFPSYGENNCTVSEMLDYITADLKIAKDLVASYDTLNSEHVLRLTKDGGNFILGSNYNPDDVFYAFRGYRMNYPAIVSIMARVYNYAGKHDEAYVAVKEVLDLRTMYDAEYYNFTPDADVSSDRKMRMDLIFAVASKNLLENYLPYSTQSGGGSGDARLVLKDWYTLFDDAADYRKTKLSTSVNGSTRYFMSNRNIQISTEENDVCPIIRLSELYYILAEYYMSKADWQEATNQLDIVRAGRNCTKGRLSITDEETFKAELLKEVRREFASEGQKFFYYKKFNEKFLSKMTQSDFILPLPESESIN